MMLSAIARSRFALLWISLLVLLFDLGLMLWFPLPEARVHDEFSYLLQADTFAHGRLSNPPHPLWEFFESNHVIPEPTYVSKYPPAQGAFLALGKILWHPVLGVWISTALAVLAMFWALQAVVSVRWAAVGAALLLFNPDVLLWNWRYWGGSVAAFGGALLLGGILHLLHKGMQWKHASAAGLGMLVLSLSRPFEGVILSLLLVTAFCWIYLQRTGDWKKLFKVISQIGVVAVLGPLFFAYYNFRTTGQPLVMPYTIHEKMYSLSPLFIWSEPNQILEFRHAIMRRFQEFYFDYYRENKLLGFFPALGIKLSDYQGLFWGGGTFVLALIPLIRMARRDILVRAFLIALPLFLIFTAGIATYAQSHYAAPVLPLIVAMMIMSLAQVEGWRWRGRSLGKILSWALVLITCCVSFVGFFAKAKIEPELHPYTGFDRAQKQKELEQLAGQHLVIVRYGEKHIFFQEWVYNDADIDGSRIVWARDMGDEKNRALWDYFKDRQIWLLQPDEKGDRRLQRLSSVSGNTNTDHTE